MQTDLYLSLEAFPDHMADLGTEGLGSEKESVHGSQPDLRRIADLPVPADFLSLSNDAKPKLMTPDAFMTPSTSLQQVIRDQHCYGDARGGGGFWYFWTHFSAGMTVIISAS